MRVRITLVVCLLALAACSKPAADTANAASATTADGAARAGSAHADRGFGGTPIAPLVQDEQRARNVQNIVNQQAAQQRKAIDQQSQ